MKLREYQYQCLNDVRESIRNGHRSVCLQLPTGGGKTVIFSEISRLANTPVMILVHRRELIRQTVASLASIGVDAGAIAPGFARTDHRVQVASVQTVVRRLQHYNPGILIVDEAHHAAAGSWRKVLDAYAGAYVIGVTATPQRLDGKGLHDLFTDLVQGPQVSELQEMGYLSQCKVWTTNRVPDMRGVGMQAGDYRASEAADAMGSAIVGDAVEHYQRHAANMPAIAFCCTVEHARQVAAQFNDAGIASLSLDGTMSVEHRDDAIAALADGRIRVLTSCQIVSEGTDIPVVGAAILLRPTKSLAMYLQQVGRALRPHANKQHAVILDHAGNAMRHGLPNDDRQWQLRPVTKQKQQAEDPLPPARTCQECFCMFPVHRTECPECGAIAQPTQREIEHREGQLQEAQRQAFRNQRAQDIRKARTVEAIRQVRIKYGYKPGWEYHRRRLLGL